MARKVVRVDQGGALKTTLNDILRNALLKDVRRVLGKAVDNEISRVFQFIASQISGSGNFAVIQPFLPSPWKEYESRYWYRKRYKYPGHLRWFSFNGVLQREFQGINPAGFLGSVGNAEVSVARGRDMVTIRTAPRLRWKLYNMEFELERIGLISYDSIEKLQNRRRAYRPMVGPVFQYFRQVRIPQAVRRALRNI